MKAITLWEPWASLVALKIKRWETRSWWTNYRGPLVIHAASKKSFHSHYMKAAQTSITAPDLKIEDLSFGQIVAVCDLTACIEMSNKMIMEMTETERMLGDWLEGRYAWKLENVRALDKPITVLGKQGLWTLPPEIMEQL